MEKTCKSCRTNPCVVRGDECQDCIGVLPCALSLHMAHSGAADPLPDDEEAARIAWLQKRLREWRSPSCPFDDAVKAVIVAALRERGTEVPSDG